MCGRRYSERNTDFNRDSSGVKGCNQHGCICTARQGSVDGLNHLKLRHNEEIWWTTYQCLLDTILKLILHDSWFQRAYCPPYTCIQFQVCITLWNWYGIDNLGEVRSTAVYGLLLIFSSWNHVNSVYVRLLMQPYNYMPRWAEPQRHTVVSLWNCVCGHVCGHMCVRVCVCVGGWVGEWVVG